MTTNKARLTQLEKRDPRKGQVFTLYSGPGTDDPDGSKLAAVRAQAGPKDTVIVIEFDNSGMSREQEIAELRRRAVEHPEIPELQRYLQDAPA